MCRCSPPQIHRYRQRVSGPLLDRIDLQLEVPAVTYHEMSGTEPGEASAIIRARVAQGRAVQHRRFGASTRCNARMNSRQIREFCGLDSPSAALFQNAVQSLHLSGRAYDRILKVARTIADLDTSDRIELPHLQEAIGYRALDRTLTG
jgi:magnesium chelatase family protein